MRPPARTIAFAAARDVFDVQLREALAAIADGPARAAGVDVGRQAARRTLASRRDDGATRSIAYRPGRNRTAGSAALLPEAPVRSRYGRIIQDNALTTDGTVWVRRPEEDPQKAPAEVVWSPDGRAPWRTARLPIPVRSFALGQLTAIGRDVYSFSARGPIDPAQAAYCPFTQVCVPAWHSPVSVPQGMVVPSRQLHPSSTIPSQSSSPPLQSAAGGPHVS